MMFFDSLTLSHIQTLLQQATIEDNETKGEIPQNKQFHLLPQCFQLDSKFKLSFTKKKNHIFAKMLS